MAADLREAEQVDLKVTEARKTIVLPLEKIIQFVRRDCRQSSDEYLEETTVPHGGE